MLQTLSKKLGPFLIALTFLLNPTVTLASESRETNLSSPTFEKTVNKSKPKLKARKAKKQKEDRWVKTQELKSRLSKEDLDDSGTPTSPLPYPSYQLESIPCDVGANSKSPAGIKTRCHF